ncbi:MAG: alpha/beta hydrolase [Pirellulaceae bacterium]|nr:alpha/beta hydrolase [Pirellulaceae bacterium]
MIVELVKTQTRDGVRLDGAITRANDVDSASKPTGLIVCLHGVGSNFYGSTMMNVLAEGLYSEQWDVLRVNTRGHDYCYVGSFKMGVRRFGSGYETVADCVQDIAAWVQWAEQLGYERVVLLGHSLGAIKTVFCQSHEMSDLVVAVLAISPPKLEHETFLVGERSGEFRASFSAAEKLIANGLADELVDVTFPFPLLITAASYVDKYGAQDRYNIVNLIEYLNVPTHFIYGGSELTDGNTAFAGLADILVDKVRDLKLGDFVSIEVIAGADHLYMRHLDTLLASARRFVEAL